MVESSITYGQVGYLDHHMEQKLQEIWSRLLTLSGTANLGSATPTTNKTTGHQDGATTPLSDKPTAEQVEDGTATEQKKPQEDGAAAAAAEQNGHTTATAEEPALDEASRKFRHYFWNSIKAEHPDSIVLRFLRARNWDIEKSLAMLVASIEWRASVNIDEAIVKRGEDVALHATRSKDDEGVMLQYRSGKSYIRATDKQGRPVYIVKPKLHHPGEQTSKAMETFILHTIESIRLLVKSPQDRACLIFDMTGFGLRNMDFHAAKFIIDVFEARYPETLGVVLIHNAPFVFSGIWRVVKGWLDPVVAAKVNFTRSGKDLLEFIDKENLLAEYGGSDTWTYQYIEPIAGENDLLKDEETARRLKAEREAIVQEFEKVTAEWAALSPEEEQAKQKDACRAELSEQLRVNYWKLDPYVRTRNIYDRWGFYDAQGNVNFKAAGSAKATGK